jgi:predicted nucleic acid-binding protein
MKLIITDTNVLFDVIKIGALPEFFSLDFDICTTVFVIDEIKSSPQREQVETFIRSKQFTVFEFTGEDIEDIINFETGRDLKRFTDKSVIWKSLELKCPMLTGDKKMREVAEKLGLEVYGSIWVIDELIRSDLISSDKAIVLFEQLLVTNSWLPRNEIEKRINKLK